MTEPITVGIEPWEGADGAALRAAQRAELDARYGSDDHEPGEPPTANSVRIFLVARDVGGTAVGCGGLRPLAAGGAEIKRMYVSPDFRGKGASVAILRALKAEARNLGLSTLLLETGTAQPDAIRFYERNGYRPIPNFGPYAGEATSLCYARELN